MIDSEKTTGFEGWVILELMGHRRLAGYLREQSLGGASFLRIDVPNNCTGISATWCPEHGDCKCPEPSIEKNDPACPLHSDKSQHGEGVLATQIYSGAAVYCITPTTEEVARKVAKLSRVEPVTAWELEKPKALPVGATYEEDDEDDEDDDKPF